MDRTRDVQTIRISKKRGGHEGVVSVHVESQAMRNNPGEACGIVTGRHVGDIALFMTLPPQR